MNPETPEAPTDITPRRSPRWGRIMAIVAVVLGVAFAVDYLIYEKTKPVLLSAPIIHVVAPDRVSVSWKMEAPYPDGFVKLSPKQGRPIKTDAERDGTAYVVTMNGLAPGSAYECRIYNRGYLGRTIKVAGPIEVMIPAASSAGGGD